MNVVVDGIECAPVKALGNRANRAVIVVDRGWIFAGDITETQGRIRISRAAWVFRWDAVGFSEVIRDDRKADIRPIDDLDIPAESEIFRIPVHDGWGL